MEVRPHRKMGTKAVRSEGKGQGRAGGGTRAVGTFQTFCTVA